MATFDEKRALFSQGSDEYNNTVCLPCHRTGTTRPAYGYCVDCPEHLCHDCFIHHKKATPSQHHNLKDKNEMPATQQLTATPVPTVTADNLSTQCPHHKLEPIKLYCQDHKQLLCCICVLKHPKPCHVDYVPEISDKIINSTDYKHVVDRIDELLTKCTSIESDSKKSKDSLNNILHEIKMYRQQINQRMDELQKTIESKLLVLQHQNDTQLNTVQRTCEDVVKELNVMYDSIKHLNTSNQANKLFIEIKQAQNQLQDYEKSIKSLSTEDIIDEYKFIPNQAISDVLQTENMLGDISTKHQTRADSASQHKLLPPSTDNTITPTCLGEIYVKTSKDKKRCVIAGMAVLPSNKLVLVDSENKAIKLVDVNSKSVVSQLSLGIEVENEPCGITSTTGTQVAVLVPQRQHIQLISVRKLLLSYKLSKAHAIQTAGECLGICCHQDKLVVTYCRPGKLEILDMSGNAITVVTTDSTGTDVFNQPVYVKANSSFIYVADRGSNMIITLKWNGDVTGRFGNIVCPRELALLSDGSILVCDGEHDKVYKVAGDRTNSRIVLQDVRHPGVVCVDDGEHKLYISRLTREDKPDNNILIYTYTNFAY